MVLPAAVVGAVVPVASKAAASESAVMGTVGVTRQDDSSGVTWTCGPAGGARRVPGARLSVSL